MKATAHNDRAVAKSPPAPHEYSDSTAQDGLEAPSPVGDSTISQIDSLPMAGASLPDSSTPMGDVAGLSSDPVLMDAITTIIQALVGRQQGMQQGVPLV